MSGLSEWRCILQSVCHLVFGLILAFTAGSEAKPESPAVNRPARTQCAAWDRVHFDGICMCSVFARVSPWNCNLWPFSQNASCIARDFVHGSSFRKCSIISLKFLAFLAYPLTSCILLLTMDLNMYSVTLCVFPVHSRFIDIRCRSANGLALKRPS